MAGEEASNLGRLTILQARRNPDLAMGDELLKKTGAGNLFMVFGEPDIEVKPAGDGQVPIAHSGATRLPNVCTTCARALVTPKSPGVE
jgi:hypothetical protein